jgi:hypothetical protein
MFGRNRQSMTQVTARHTVRHQDNLRRSLQHRIEVARSQGNEALIQQLEAEAQYLQ